MHIPGKQLTIGILFLAGLPLVALEAEWQLKTIRQNLVAPSRGNDTLQLVEKTTPVADSPELSGIEFLPDGRNGGIVADSPANNRTDNFLLETVFKPYQVDGYRTICWKGNRMVEPQRIQYYLSIFNGKLEFKFKDAQGEWFNFSTIHREIRPNQWYHAAIRFSDGKAQITINGRECKVSNPYSKGKELKALVANHDPLYIGTGHSGSTLGIRFNFHGIIRSIRLADLSEPDANLIALTRQGRAIRLAQIDEKNTKIDKTTTASLRETAEKLLNSNDSAAAENALDLYGTAVEKILAEQSQKNRAVKYQTFLEKYADGKPFALFTLPTARGIKRDTDFMNQLRHSVPVEMKAARGETESFQIAAAVGSKALVLSLQFSGFRTREGKKLTDSATVWGEIRDITARTTMLGDDFSSKDTPEYIGSWPDLIVDDNPATLQAKADRCNMIFFRVDVPRDAVPGVYAGEFSVTGNGVTEKLPIRLTVRSFEIPRNNSIPVVFSFFKHFYTQWYNLKKLTPAQDDAINRYLIAYRMPPCNIYDNQLNPSLEEIRKYDLNFATPGYFIYKKLLSEKELDSLIAQYRPRLEQVYKAGLKDGVYLYSFDEIVGMGEHKKTFPAAKQTMVRFKQEFPWLKRLQTSEPHPDLLNTFDVWVPLFPYFVNDNHKVRELQTKGTEFWWYTADAPYKPYVNFFLGYPQVDLRVIMTMTYQKKIKGILYWCINREWADNRKIRDRWPADSSSWTPGFSNAFSKQMVYRNGMGNFLYPGPDGRIYPSLRVENFRDGVEDYEYYILLEKALAELRRKSPNSPLIAEAEACLKVPADVATDIHRYNHAPEPLMRQHDKLGDMIETINSAIK